MKLKVDSFFFVFIISDVSIIFNLFCLAIIINKHLPRKISNWSWFIRIIVHFPILYKHCVKWPKPVTYDINSLLETLKLIQYNLFAITWDVCFVFDFSSPRRGHGCMCKDILSWNEYNTSHIFPKLSYVVYWDWRNSYSLTHHFTVRAHQKHQILILRNFIIQM